MKKTFIFSLAMAMIIASSLALPLVSAHCPLCTAGAVAGLGFARTLGVDDSIVGLLFGALIASSGLWAHNILKKKNINLPVQGFVLIIISFLLLAVPLYMYGTITAFAMVTSMPEHHSMLGMGIYGIDKLLFGMIIGTMAISGAFTFSDNIKEKRGKVLFPFQGLVFMIVALAILSSIFWLITK